MSDKYMEMYDELSNLTSKDESLNADSVMEILKNYSSSISVFDMMEFTSKVMKENRYVQESYREDSQKSYIESILMRIKDISNDHETYNHNIDKDSFIEAIEILKSHYEIGNREGNPKVALIFEIASIYATFI